MCIGGKRSLSARTSLTTLHSERHVTLPTNGLEVRTTITCVFVRVSSFLKTDNRCF